MILGDKLPGDKYYSFRESIFFTLERFVYEPDDEELTYTCHGNAERTTACSTEFTWGVYHSANRTFKGYSGEVALTNEVYLTICDEAGNCVMPDEPFKIIIEELDY